MKPIPVDAFNRDKVFDAEYCPVVIEPLVKKLFERWDPADDPVLAFQCFPPLGF